MPVGGCQAAFAEAAAQDGIALERCSLPWINQRGHFGLPNEASSAVEALGRICAALDGDADDQRGKRLTALCGDFIHRAKRTIIEVDEVQHFTPARLTTLRLYPTEAPLGFDLDQYVSLCERHRTRADKYRFKKEARGFPGEGGRQRQRAYYDALRDLSAQALGYAPVIRIPVFDDNGRAAYRANRDRLRAALSL